MSSPQTMRSPVPGDLVLTDDDYFTAWPSSDSTNRSNVALVLERRGSLVIVLRANGLETDESDQTIRLLPLQWPYPLAPFVPKYLGLSICRASELGTQAPASFVEALRHRYASGPADSGEM